MLLRPIPFGELKESVEGCVVRDDEGAAMSDPLCCSETGQGQGGRRLRFTHGLRDDGAHRPVGDLDPPEAVLRAEFDAGAVGGVSADHPSAQIFAVAEAAQCGSLQFDCLRLARQDVPRNLSGTVSVQCGAEAPANEPLSVERNFCVFDHRTPFS